jgi:hypothetical protein
MKKLFNNFFNHVGKLGQEGTAESSKRTLALHATIVLGSYVVVAFTNDKNMEFVLGELLTFSLALLGVTAWEKTTLYKNNKISKHKSEENENS